MGAIAAVLAALWLFVWGRGGWTRATVSDEAEFAAAPAPPALGEDQPGPAMRAEPLSMSPTPRELADRLGRAVDAVNSVLGRSYDVSLGQVAGGGQADGGGTFRLDFLLVRRLSEPALVALVAHEFAHEWLGHNQASNRIRRSFVGVHGASASREQESEADQAAGEVLAALGLPAGAFEELLGAVPDSIWSGPVDRGHPTHEQRLAAFNRGYASRCAARQTAEAARDGHGASQSVARP